MVTSDVKVTPGSGSNVATNSITEDAETKQLQRVVINNSSGSEVGSDIPLGTGLNTYSAVINTNGTTTLTSSTAYISVIVISIPTLGTASNLTIQDKQGTPLKIINSLSTASQLTGGNDIYSFTTPVKMVSGIDIITSGSLAATIDLWINYFQ